LCPGGAAHDHCPGRDLTRQKIKAKKNVSANPRAGAAPQRLGEACRAQIIIHSLGAQELAYPCRGLLLILGWRTSLRGWGRCCRDTCAAAPRTGEGVGMDELIRSRWIRAVWCV